MYKHGIYTSTTDTENTATAKTTMAQVVIGTAPIHYTADPSQAVNKPILCNNIAEARTKLGYSEDFEKYTLCQSMYTNFFMMKVAPVVFINVLDPSKHKETVSETEIPVTNNSIIINDDVIVSTLVIKFEETPVTADKYEAEWVNGALVVNFTEEKSGNATVSYDKIDTSLVTATDIIGEYDTETGTRTGMELIKNVFPQYGVVPLILTAPGWSEDDTVGAILASKTTEINGRYKALAITDLDTKTSTTKAKAIEEKKGRTLNENCIATYPMVKKGERVIAYSALLSSIIMAQATTTGGVTCKSPSNYNISIDDCVLADGTSVYFDTEDGNELNAEGIVTIIARNGWYTWGNNTAAYPTTTDPVKRWIMTRLSFMYIENDFINSNFSMIDSALSPKMIENMITDENIKLSAYAAAGYIIGGKMYYNAGDNPVEDILNGHFTFRTSLAGNIPTESIDNIFSFDINMLEQAFTGGEQ